MRKRGSRTRASLEILVTLAALAIAFPSLCSRTILRRTHELQLGSWLAAVEGVSAESAIPSHPPRTTVDIKRRFLGALITV